MIAESGFNLAPYTERVEKMTDVNWRIMAGPDGKLPGEQITHALLMDVREALRSIRKMMIFFTVLVVIGLIVETLAVMAR